VPLLSQADPHLAEQWTLIRAEYCAAHPGKDLMLTCVYRSPEEQQRLYAQGRTMPGQIVTELDGVKKKSNHNVLPARAVDFCVVIHGKVSWDVAEYEPVGALAEVRGLVWGGSWPNFKDAPHIELPH
jgi:peptidoglycan L-alanyl-D-glutamate endopeptidase CwlK